MTLSPTQQRQRNCVEGTPRRWYGEDERTGRDEWCFEHRQHRLRIRERAWRTHSAHDLCFDHGRSGAIAKEPRRGGK